MLSAINLETEKKSFVQNIFGNLLVEVFLFSRVLLNILHVCVSDGSKRKLLQFCWEN